MYGLHMEFFCKVLQSQQDSGQHVGIKGQGHCLLLFLHSVRPPSDAWMLSQANSQAICSLRLRRSAVALLETTREGDFASTMKV